MRDRCTIIIAGYPIGITCENPELYQGIQKKYRIFTTSREPQFHVEINWEQSLVPLKLENLGVNYRPDKVFISAPGIHGQGNLQNKTAELTVQAVNPLDGLDYFLRTICAALAFEAKGFMVHGAGIVHRGKGYLFFGRSGSGKTTVSRNSIQEKVLNDDLVVLLPEGDSWRIYSTPFWNPTQVEPRLLSTILASMYRLVQDTAVFLEPMKSGQALAELQTNIPVITSNPEASIELIDRCKRLLGAIPIYRLHFLPDNSFWRVIDK